MATGEQVRDGWRENVAYALLPLIIIAVAAAGWQVCTQAADLAGVAGMPHGAVLAGRSHGTQAALVCIQGVTALFAACFFGIAVARGIPFMRHNLREGTFRTGGPGAAIACLCLTLLGVTTAAATGSLAFSVSQDGVYERARPFAVPRHYRWVQVRRIETSCTKYFKDRSWFYSANFVLVMEDGHAVDLTDIGAGYAPVSAGQGDNMDDYSAFFRAYPALAAHLRGVPFHYNISSSFPGSSACREQWRPYFTAPPK